MNAVDDASVPRQQGACAMLAPVDWIILGFVGLLAIGFAIAVGVALDRDRALDATRAALARSSLGLSPLVRGSAVDRDAAGTDVGRQASAETDDPSADVPTLVRRLRDRLDASEFELDQQVRNASYLADLMGVGIVRLDAQGRVELANAAAHIFLRRPVGSLTGRTAVETFLDSRVEELIAAAQAGGGASGEFRLSGPDGPTLVVRARRSPVSGVWVVLEDVSELRRLQQIRTQFVDNLSHELRTPLSTVSLLAETLARDAEAAGDGVPPRMRDRIGKIELETGHLVQMVNELLDLARIEGGGPLVLLDDVDLGRVASEASERLRLFAERQGLRLVVDVPDRLPPVRGDEARLGQVVVNLVHNALKFGRPEDRPDTPDDRANESADGVGGAADGDSWRPGAAQTVTAEPDSAEVRVSVRASGDAVLLTVEDHGVGIPAADRARIFERFYKVDRVRVRGGGTGLGLAIARHVVGQHGGTIQVDSEEGRGSTFTVSLPVARPVGRVSGDFA
jgi:two-component system phosphate regulon sensor histidine kinase PhoR